MRNREIYADRNDAIVAMWNAGQSAKEIAPKFAMDVGEVSKVVCRRRKRGDAVRWGWSAASKSRNDQIIQLVGNGVMSYRQAAKAVGVTHNVVAGVVYRWRIENGIAAANQKRERW